jgi:hypothetical protein
MRGVVLVLALLCVSDPALAQSDPLPEGVEQLMTCSTVYSMKSDEARAAGDEGTATEMFHMGDNLLYLARSRMQTAGYTAQTITDVEMNYALMIGFRYGAGEGEAMLADCLAAEDTP